MILRLNVWVVHHLSCSLRKAIGLEFMNTLLQKIFISNTCILTSLMIESLLLEHLAWTLVQCYIFLCVCLCSHNNSTDLLIIISILINLLLLPLYNILKYPKVLIHLIKIIDLDLKSVRLHIFGTLILTLCYFLWCQVSF